MRRAVVAGMPSSKAASTEKLAHRRRQRERSFEG